MNLDLSVYQDARNQGTKAGQDAALALYNDPAGFARLTTDSNMVCNLAHDATTAAGYDLQIDPLQPILYRDVYVASWLAGYNGMAICMIGGNPAINAAYTTVYGERAAQAQAEWRAAQAQEDAEKSRAAALVAGALAQGDNTAPAAGEPEPRDPFTAQGADDAWAGEE